MDRDINVGIIGVFRGMNFVANAVLSGKIKDFIEIYEEASTAKILIRDH